MTMAGGGANIDMFVLNILEFLLNWLFLRSVSMDTGVSIPQQLSSLATLLSVLSALIVSASFDILLLVIYH